jgi:hypothetical protein|uniref:Protein BIC1 n=2 Tax=Zea mays TaxID=4577 RepID=A0A804REU1_MAIZE
MHSLVETGCGMASFSDVEALPETGEVDHQAKECEAETAVTEENLATLQEQHDDKAPVPYHQEVFAPEHAGEAPAPEEHGDEKDLQVAEPKAAADDQESTRDRLKRHRREMAGRVWVPETWGQEKLLKDWVDCAVFDRPMVPMGLLTARRALIAECCTRRPDRAASSSSSTSSSNPLRVRNGCS